MTVDLVADMEVINPFDFFVEPYAETFPFAYPPELREELAPYLELRSRRAAPRRTDPARSARRARNTIDFLVELNQRLQRDDPLSDPHGARRADAGGDA